MGLGLMKILKAAQAMWRRFDRSKGAILLGVLELLVLTKLMLNMVDEDRWLLAAMLLLPVFLVAGGVVLRARQRGWL